MFWLYKILLLFWRSAINYLIFIFIALFMKYNLSNLQEYDFGTGSEYIEMAAYSILSFFVPFLLGHPQLLVGALVNAFLISAALNLKGYKLLPVIMMPCLGVLTAGIIFGPLSMFLVYFIPFIWIGNSILVFAFKYFRLYRKYNYIVTLVLGTAMKSAFLFLSAVVLYSLGIVPVMFLTAMGLIQVTTALIGGAAAYGFHYSKKYLAQKF
jgi:hypothetical protein